MLKPDTIIPGLEVPNLDCLSPEDLDNFCDAAEALSKLAWLIRSARGFRLNGQIEGALRLERQADTAYQALPQSMRY